MKQYEREHLYVRLGENIRAARAAIGMTQAELAKNMKLLRPSIANIETGRQNVMLHQVEEFAQALGVAPEELVPLPSWGKSKSLAKRVSERKKAQKTAARMKLDRLAHQVALLKRGLGR